MEGLFEQRSADKIKCEKYGDKFKCTALNEDGVIIAEFKTKNIEIGEGVE